MVNREQKTDNTVSLLHRMTGPTFEPNVWLLDVRKNSAPGHIDDRLVEVGGDRAGPPRLGRL